MKPWKLDQRDKAAWSWALYDWANSAFAMTVLVGFFPVFFKKYWATGLSNEESTLWFGFASSAYAILVAVLAPILGAVADARQIRKPLLFGLMLLGSWSSIALFFVPEGSWLIALLVFVLACIGFMLGNVLYDSLLVNVSTEADVDQVSARGFGLGYLGCGLLFAVHVAMVGKPQWFGIADSSMAVKIAFVSVGIWWMLFSIPLFMQVRERPTNFTPASARAGIRNLLNTIRHIRSQKVMLMFLLAYFLYIDGVNTISKMAADFGVNMGFSAEQLMLSLLMLQFIAFPCTFATAWLANRVAPKKVLLGLLAVYVAVALYATVLESTWQFYLIAVMVGTAIGGVPALSRSLFSRLVPKGRSAEYYGFYGMFGRFAAVIGPPLVGLTTYLSGDARWSLLPIALLLIVGGGLLWRVDIPDRQPAQQPVQ